jgi:hypothetical protein
VPATCRFFVAKLGIYWESGGNVYLNIMNIMGMMVYNGILDFVTLLMAMKGHRLSDAFGTI